MVGDPAGGSAAEERFQQLFNDDAASRTTLQTFIHEAPERSEQSLANFMGSLSDELGEQTFYESKTVRLAEKELQIPV